MKFYVSVYQEAEVIEVKIRNHQTDDSGDSISAYIKRMTDKNISNIRPNMYFGYVKSVEEAYEISEWWRIAAATAETLAATITTPADFDKEWTARIVGRTVFIETAQKD